MTPKGAYAPSLVRTVSDITAEHEGWLLKVYAADDFLPHWTFTLGRGFRSGPSRGPVRAWTRPDGSCWVGLTDDDARAGIVGSEHHFPAETRCDLVRQVTKPRKSGPRRMSAKPDSRTLGDAL